MIVSRRICKSFDFSDSAGDTQHGSSKNTNDGQKWHIPVLSLRNTEYRPRAIDIWALGITIVIGGQYFNWNRGLAAGFGTFCVATFLIGVAYICLCFCTSELASALPFAGGGYGLARVTLGFYAGFMVGCIEIMEYIIYTADTCLSLGDVIIKLSGTERKFAPLVWLVFYVSAVSVYCIGGKIFWRVSNMLAFLSITILFIYLTGSLKFTNFNHAKSVAYNPLHVMGDMAPDSSHSRGFTLSGPSADYTGNPWFIGGGTSFMKVLPLAGWMYVGIESLNFAANDVDEPKKTIPIGVMSCISVLFVTSIAVLFVSSTLPQGKGPVAYEESPLTQGFMLMFEISETEATILSIPATYATAFGFIFSYGRLMLAMSESRLLPRVLRIKWGNARKGTPSMAFVVGSGVGYILCIFVYFFPELQKHLFNICILCAFGAYIAQFVSFLNIRTRFMDLPRLYRSPLGISGALIGILIFLTAAIAVIAFQNDGYTAFISVAFICLANTLYYFLVAKHHQKFSRDELRTLFNAHVFKLGSVSNKSRLDRAKRSAKRSQKRSYDSDRNSYSGDVGDYKRNSSESLNAAMRSIVQKSRDKRDGCIGVVQEIEAGINTNGAESGVGEGEGGVSGREGGGGKKIDYASYGIFGSNSALSARGLAVPVEQRFTAERSIGSTNRMMTPTMTKMAAKSMPALLLANDKRSNRKVAVMPTPVRPELNEDDAPSAKI